MVDWTGWIVANEEDRGFLESLGITLGPRKDALRPGLVEFDGCSVPGPAFEKLETHWGRFIWGLEAVSTTPSTES